MAQPNKKGPEKSVDVYCLKCKHPLFRYRKGGKGALVKCFKQRISKDFTTEPGICPGCQVQFARDVLVRGAPAWKIIGGKAAAK